MSNHLIIGLGGTGGKVIRELRKRVYEEFRSNDPGGGVNLDYVYVDSSPADLNDRTGWKVMGKSVHLGEAQKVSINGVNASMLQNLNMYPGLHCFINDSDKRLIDEHMGPLITAGIGGQRRRLGRILIANNLSDRNNTRNFDNVVRSAVARLQHAEPNDNDVTFHICAGLAGGTGSGSIVDAIAQIRKLFPYEESTHAFKIRLFLYVPERNVEIPSHDNGFYQANGYAALLELNAISTGHYAPLDVTGEKDVFSQDVQRLLGRSQESFEAAYIYTNVNEAGKKLDLSSGLPASVADFMFQTIVVANLTGGKGKMARLVGCENDGAGPEQDQGGEKNRSRKFLSFGITRIEYPETEIAEFVSYSYAVQAACQLAYNLWQDGVGYGECSLEEVGTGFLDEIKDKKNRERFLLSNACLTLAKPIIEGPNTKRWRDFSITWEERMQQDAGLVQKQFEKKQWFAEFTKFADNYYNESFRAHGVKKFYDIQREQIRGYARHIRRHIEKILFDEWASGTKDSKSVLEIEKYAQLLRGDCSDRITTFKQQIGNMEAELQEFAQKIKVANTEWEAIGWLKDALTNASSKVFASYKSAKCNYYITATRMEAYQFGISLLQEIVVELGNMIEGIKAFKDELNAVLKVVAAQAESKCQKSAMGDEAIIKKYDPDKVRQLVHQYTVNFAYQNDNAAEIRSRMIASLGEDGERTFANLYSSVDFDTASDIILDTCTKNARAAMEDTANSDPLMKMVGVNILDKLKNELNSDEKIEAFVKQAVASAMPYVQLNAEETNKVIAGNEGGMMTMVQLALPKAGSDSTQAFVNKLLDAFAQTVPGFVPKSDGDLSENFKQNQIVVVCAKAGFPIRYAENLKVLKDRYDRLLAAPQGALNRMVLHTESFAKPLPPLFELDSREIMHSVKKPLMLAFAMQLVQPQQDPTTGERFFAMNIPDDVFGDNWVKLSKDFAGCLDVLAHDFKKFTLLSQQVDAALGKQARSNEQKAAMRKAVGGVVQQVILPTMCEGNQFDPKYAEYKKLAMEIFDKELKDL